MRRDIRTFGVELLSTILLTRNRGAAFDGKHRSIFTGVYYNTAGAFHDAKRTLQGFMHLFL
jgi:hypothetical protein